MLVNKGKMMSYDLFLLDVGDRLGLLSRINLGDE